MHSIFIPVSSLSTFQQLGYSLYTECDKVKHMGSYYLKGAYYERELLSILNEKGFAVIRAAGSGGNISVPDIIGIKSSQVLAFECKAWAKEPRLRPEKLKDLINWVEKAGAMGFVAWRHDNKWEFKNAKDMKNKEKEWMNITTFLSCFL